ncbi:uncharacterized protein DNG_07213 [Cephalotrichum gorgonifer]|uniref:2EXR domain-containing protein n=1 Tax=Cephalotrichum gorgonifer TaxID=2041049 RepID=A0AAE8SX90_9PEZI|nr:uncharacterized protein DNG_07213 [Cephalotrichum gorgonifer]
MEDLSCRDAPLQAFHLFPQLPAEIRLQIWSESFLPRALELHSRRAHYANIVPDARSGAPPAFQSRCFNPAALYVSVEARRIALQVYIVALPLALEQKGLDHDRPRDLVLSSRRVLYVALDRDTIVLLGDVPAARVTQLVHWFRRHDLSGGVPVGLRRFSTSAGHFAHDHGAAMLRIVGQQLFSDLDYFALSIGRAARSTAPPAWWSGGRCYLRELQDEVEAQDDDGDYREFLNGVGRQFKQGSGWMKIGRNEMRIASVCFENGW